MKSSGRIRVTTGSAGGLYLKVPPGFTSRPTQDRIKQAIFSSFAAKVPGAHVLDLYAGTGSLGIEALSRGAASATFVESNAAVCATLKENLEYCRLEGNIVCRDVPAYLAEGSGPTFDIILADPPYLKGKHEAVSSGMIRLLAGKLNPGGLLVWEHDSRNSWPAQTALKLLKTTRYGETAVTCFELAG